MGLTLVETTLVRAYVKVVTLRKNQNLAIVCQNLTGMTYLQFFGHNASLKLKNILETNETSFASYSLVQ